MARIVGNRFGNTLRGTAANDRFIAQGGKDFIYGNGGKDVIFAGDGNDWIFLGTATSTSMGSYIFGGNGNDHAFLYLQAFTADIVIGPAYGHVYTQNVIGTRRSIVAMDSVEAINAYLGSGNDYVHTNDADLNFIYGYGGNDTLLGGAGDDYLFGGVGEDLLKGGAGSDSLSGGDGDDVIDGGEGKDTLVGEGGVDQLSGGAGDDRLYGGAGDDRISGGADDDMLSGEDGDDILYGNAGRDILLGDAGADVLRGGADGDRLYGADGDDLLYGEDGRDYLFGGRGADRLYGGLGPDQLTGNQEHDRFIWASPDEGGDRVMDFMPGQDLLVLERAGFGGIAVVDANNFVANANGVAKDADDRFLYAIETGGLFYDPDGNGAAAKILIAHISYGDGASATVIGTDDIVMV